MKELSSQELSRFWSKVLVPDDLDECFEWLAGKNSEGYGTFFLQRKQRLAHRVSFFIKNGKLLNELLMHSCDHPWCVNPRHLSHGTPQDNSRDMVAKGRNWNGGLECRSGEKNGRSRLTETQVAEIRTLLLEGSRQKDIAKIYSVGTTTISDIKTGKRWVVF